MYGFKWGFIKHGLLFICLNIVLCKMYVFPIIFKIGTSRSKINDFFYFLYVIIT